MTSTVTVTPYSIPTSASPIGARLYHPGAGARAASLVWLHGGGFTGGDLDMPEADWVGRSLAERGHPVITVDYRLANESVRYPEPTNDVLAAWAWVNDNRARLQLTETLHLGGASAGANLATGATMRIRDNDPTANGNELPATLILAYPTLHAVQQPPSAELSRALQTLPDEYQRGADYVLRLYTNLMPDGALDAAGGVNQAALQRNDSTSTDATSSDPASTARMWAAAIPGTADPSGLPPTLIAGSEADPLRASAEEFVASLAAHGVEHEYFVEPATRHGHLNQPDTPGAVATIDHFHAWLSRHESR
jgi:acetyl esterase/lipase